MKRLYFMFKVGALLLTLSSFPSPARACDDMALLGSICFTSSSYCPQKMLPAQGQLMQINVHQAMFALLGKRFGGDGHTTFALPDFRNKTELGLACIVVEGYWPQKP